MPLTTNVCEAITGQSANFIGNTMTTETSVGVPNQRTLPVVHKTTSKMLIVAKDLIHLLFFIALCGIDVAVFPWTIFVFFANMETGVVPLNWGFLGTYAIYHGARKIPELLAKYWESVERRSSG